MAARAATTERRRSAGPDRISVWLFSLAALLAVLALLAGQVRGQPVHLVQRPVRLMRQIYETTVIETVVGSRARVLPAQSVSAQSVSGTGGGGAPPAPAPVISRSS